MKKILFALYAFMFFSTAAKAEVTLLDKDNWKVTATGFAEFDMTYDTVKGFGETAGNSPVLNANIDPYAASTHTLHTSVRNSRLGFGFEAPKMNDWKTRGYFEMDFLGYDPNQSVGSATAPKNSEAGFANNGTMRVRHVYLAAEKDGWQVLTGQTWSLLGWQSTFVPTTLSVAPVSGILYERTAQINIMKTTEVGSDQKLVMAVALSRPSERDSGTPSLDAGIKWSHAGRKSGLNGTYADTKLQPFTVALSGTLRRFTSPTGSLDSHKTYTGGAVALDVLIPVITGDESAANTLTLTGEFSAGKGYGDEFPGWTGNLPQLASSTTTPNLDAGIGALDANGSFQLVQLQSWNVQLQYHLQEDSIIDAGYSTLHSTNAAQLTGAHVYNRSTTYFVNYLHDMTKNWRVGAEFDLFNTAYVTDGNGIDRRFMVSSNYRF